MGKTKYVIYNDGGVRLFDEKQAHNEMRRHDADIISAAFVSFYPTRDGEIIVSCYGESISMRMKAQLGDEKKIAIALGLWDNYEDEPSRFYMEEKE